MTTTTDIAEAAVHPCLAEIEPALLARAVEALGHEDAAELGLADFPSLDTEEEEDRELRIEALGLARHLLWLHPEASDNDAQAISTDADELWFEGIIITAELPGHEGLLAAAHLVEAEDYTLAPQAPAGPVAALACACALLRVIDRLHGLEQGQPADPTLDRFHALLAASARSRAAQQAEAAQVRALVIAHAPIGAASVGFSETDWGMWELWGYCDADGQAMPDRQAQIARLTQVLEPIKIERLLSGPGGQMQRPAASKMALGHHVLALPLAELARIEIPAT